MGAAAFQAASVIPRPSLCKHTSQLQNGGGGGAGSYLHGEHGSGPRDLGREGRLDQEGCRDDDETVESLWSDWDIPRRMMQVALWIKEKNEETGEWESTFWKMLEESKCDDWSFQGHTI